MLLLKVLQVYADASIAGALQHHQIPIAASCRVLEKRLMGVAIIALVDEATGYQEERAKDELVKILEAYIAPELMPWTSKFPNEFFRQIYRIHGWEYRPGSAKPTPYVGKLINKYIYEKLPPWVFDEMKRKNPVTKAGYRRNKHYRYLTGDTGIPHLGRQVEAVQMLMRISDDAKEFEYNFQKAFAPEFQERLPLVIKTSEDDPDGKAK